MITYDYEFFSEITVKEVKLDTGNQYTFKFWCSQFSGVPGMDIWPDTFIANEITFVHLF